MSVNTERSMNAGLQAGLTDGTYHKRVTDREPTEDSTGARDMLHDWTINTTVEAPVKHLPTGGMTAV